MNEIDNLIDPPVTGKILRSLDERQVATLNKNYLTQSHSNLASATSNLVVALTGIMDSMFDVNEMVLTKTDLATSLGKIYRSVLDHLEKLNTELSTIEGSTYPDVILKSTAELRKTWTGLQLLLTHQITEPLLSSVCELARENALKSLSAIIYGGRTSG